MSERLPEISNSVLDRLPSIVGKAVVETCLSSFPLYLLGFNILRTAADEMISIRNEKQVLTLLDSLKEKIEELEEERVLTKESLKTNVLYQEIAQKRLLLVAPWDSEEDLDLSAKLVALCGIIDGDNPKDKYILNSLGGISPDEIRLFFLLVEIRKEMEERKKNFSDDERRDAQSDVNLELNISIKFFNEGEKLLHLYDFTHVLSRLHSFGFIEAQKNGGFTSYNRTPKVYPPQLTPVGFYFLERLKAIGV